MSQENKTGMTKEQVNEKLKKLASEKQPAASGKLPDEALDSVTGGVGAWAFECEGYVAMAFCNKNEVTNAEFEMHLYMETACEYTAKVVKNCYECPYAYITVTNIPVL